MSIRKRWIVLAAVAALTLVTGGVVSAVAEDAAADGTEIRSMSFNVCGAATATEDCKDKPSLKSWTASVVTEMKREDSDVVGFQELCFAQWKSLRGKLSKEYKPVWVSTVGKAAGCGHWKQDNPDWETGDDRFGVGMFVKTTAEVERYYATLDSPAGEEKRAVLCAKAPLNGLSVLACSTHLATYIKPDNGVSQVLDHIDAWKGDAVPVLTADLNAAPHYAAADALYERYTEADSTDTEYFTKDCAGAETCRTGAVTVDPEADAEPRKIDFVFTPAAPADVSATVSPTELSDHHILRAVTRV